MTTSIATATCTICGQPADQPYRRRDAGHVTEGCVAAFHDEHADAWHNRPEARAIRARTSRHDDGRTRHAIPRTQVTLDTGSYIFAHGHTPRGHGGWAFTAAPKINGEELYLTDCDEYPTAPIHGIETLAGRIHPKFWNGLYTDAKRQAITAAARVGLPYIEVAS